MFDYPGKLNKTQLPPCETFLSKLRNSNPPENDYLAFKTLKVRGETFKEALSKLKLSQSPPTGQEKYQYLIAVWKQENFCTFKDFLRWCNNKDAVPTLKAIQKVVDFYHNKENDMLELGCALPNLTNICLHKSPTAKIYPFTENDEDLLEKIREDMVGGPFIVCMYMENCFRRDTYS